MFLIHRLVFIVLMLSSSFLLSGQRAGIVGSEFQLSGILDGERLAWNTSKAEIYLDKSVGELKAFIFIDDLSMIDKPSQFEEGQERDQDNFIAFTCQLPLQNIIENNNELVNTRQEVRIEYKGLTTTSFFDFNILSLKRQGFSIVCQGYIEHQDLEVPALTELDDQMFVIWSIIGI